MCHPEVIREFAGHSKNGRVELPELVEGFEK
jgi:hypothetical protein